MGWHGYGMAHPSLPPRVPPRDGPTRPSVHRPIPPGTKVLPGQDGLGERGRDADQQANEPSITFLSLSLSLSEIRFDGYKTGMEGRPF